MDSAGAADAADAGGADGAVDAVPLPQAAVTTTNTPMAARIRIRISLLLST
jgi:hypothetical protein